MCAGALCGGRRIRHRIFLGDRGGGLVTFGSLPGGAVAVSNGLHGGAPLIATTLRLSVMRPSAKSFAQIPRMMVSNTLNRRRLTDYSVRRASAEV